MAVSNWCPVMDDGTDSVVALVPESSRLLAKNSSLI